MTCVKSLHMCVAAAKGKSTSGDPTRLNTDAIFSGGSNRSSVEALVMRVERRIRVTRVDCTTNTLCNASRNIRQFTKWKDSTSDASHGTGGLQVCEEESAKSVQKLRALREA